jgi:hypothetical protein
MMRNQEGVISSLQRKVNEYETGRERIRNFERLYFEIRDEVSLMKDFIQQMSDNIWKHLEEVSSKSTEKSMACFYTKWMEWKS